MKIQTIETYRCEHCNKLYLRKHACANHENTCSRNPSNDRACFGCWHLIKKETSVLLDTYNGEQERKVDLLFCEKKHFFLYPPKVERKGNAFDLGDLENKAMPINCNEKNDDIDLSVLFGN